MLLVLVAAAAAEPRLFVPRAAPRAALRAPGLADWPSRGPPEHFRAKLPRLSLAAPPAQPVPAERDAARKRQSIVIVGGGVSGIYAALTLRDLGYTNVPSSLAAPG